MYEIMINRILKVSFSNIFTSLQGDRPVASMTVTAIAPPTSYSGLPLGALVKFCELLVIVTAGKEEREETLSKVKQCPLPKLGGVGALDLALAMTLVWRLMLDHFINFLA